MISGKFSLAEMKKALAYFEANTAEVNLTVSIDGATIVFGGFDRQDHSVEVVLYDANVNMLPKKKTVSTL